MSHQADTSGAVVEREPITCAEYEPFEGSRRCKRYLPSGACTLPLRLTCVEWLKLVRRRANPAPRVSAPEPRLGLVDSAASEESAPVRQQETFELSAPPARPRLVPSPAAPARPTAHTPGPTPAETKPAVAALTQDDVESFKELRAEVCIVSPVVGELWLVGEYTGSDRREISAADVAKLTMISAAFPGACVASFKTARERASPDTAPSGE
jgi:hypothetical protein